jgi:hypothetical protein
MLVVAGAEVLPMVLLLVVLEAVGAAHPMALLSLLPLLGLLIQAGVEGVVAQTQLLLMQVVQE